MNQVVKQLTRSLRAVALPVSYSVMEAASLLGVTERRMRWLVRTWRIRTVRWAGSRRVASSEMMRARSLKIH